MAERPSLDDILGIPVTPSPQQEEEEGSGLWNTIKSGLMMGADPAPAATPIPDPAPAPAPAPAPTTTAAPAPPPDQGKDEAGENVKQVIEQTEKVVKATPDKVAEQVTGQIEEMGVDVNKAYDEWVEKFGGFKKPDLELTKEKKGLLLMDFGMRLMAASGRWNSHAASAVGEAGLGTMAQHRADQQQEFTNTLAQNEMVDRSARDMTGLEAERGALHDVVSSKSGLLGVTKAGDPMPLRKPDGTPYFEDPDSRLGRGRSPSVTENLRGWYMGQGIPKQLATEMAQGKAEGPYGSAQSGGEAFEKLRTTVPPPPLWIPGSKPDPVTGERPTKRANEFDGPEIQAWIAERDAMLRAAGEAIHEQMRGNL